MRYRVVITSHAYEQWQERVGKASMGKVRTVVMHGLYHAMALGIKANKRGAFEVEIKRNLIAVVVPGSGCWVVVTFIAKAPPGRVSV